MAAKKQPHSTVFYVKQTSKWLYYATTMFIMLAAFNLYYQDEMAVAGQETHETTSGPVYVWLLVVLNICIVILIWFHFTYRKKKIVLITVMGILGILGYRYSAATSFNFFSNVPILVALASGLTWMACDFVHQEEEDSMGDKASDSPSPTSNSSSVSMDSAEKGDSKSATSESTTMMSK